MGTRFRIDSKTIIIRLVLLRLYFNFGRVHPVPKMLNITKEKIVKNRISERLRIVLSKFKIVFQKNSRLGMIDKRMERKKEKRREKRTLFDDKKKIFERFNERRVTAQWMRGQVTKENNEIFRAFV